VRPDLVYDDRGLMLDLYTPESGAGSRCPVVVLIHGGGFRGQSRKDGEIERIAVELAAHGIVAASIDHRLLHEDPQPSPHLAHLVHALPGVSIPATVVAAMEDTLAAIDYIRDRDEELGVDADRLGLIGASTGAITAAHIAYALDDHNVMPPVIRFVASLWGGVFLTPYEITGGDPALFAVHGDADELMPVGMSDDLVSRAAAAGVRTEYHRIEGGTHGFAGVDFFAEPFRQLIEFARAQV